MNEKNLQTAWTGRVRVVIPALNESGNIALIVREVLQLGLPVTVVDDGSTDSTADAARSAGAQVIRHPLRKGNGATLKTALEKVEEDFLLVIDADGQHPPQEIPALLQNFGEYDLVVGARNTESDSSKFRDFGNFFLNRFASFLSDRQIPDLTSGFRLIDRKKALDFLHLYPNGFSFPTTSTLAFLSAGYNVRFHSFKAHRRYAGSKSHIRPWQDGMRFLLMIVRIATLMNPLRIFLPMALVLILGGLGFTVRNLVAFNRFSEAGVLFLVVGINILFSGIVVDLLASLRLRRN